MLDFGYFLASTGSDGKESVCNAGDLGSIPRLARSPGEGNGYPFQYSCLQNPRDKRSLAGYSPWGCKEADKTEGLSMHACGLPLPSSKSVFYKLHPGVKRMMKSL